MALVGSTLRIGITGSRESRLSIEPAIELQQRCFM